MNENIPFGNEGIFSLFLHPSMEEEKKVGRPRAFRSEQELQEMVDSYFEYIKGDYHFEADPNDEGKDIKITDRYAETPSITGMALYLGFESRQSIYDYEKNGEFSYTIKRAKLRVEAAYEQALLSRAAVGAIFALKNFGWKDKQDIEHTGAMVMHFDKDDSGLGRDV